MKYNIGLSIYLLTAIFQGCDKPQEKKEIMDKARDFHSYAIPSEARVKHLNWDVSVDFDNQTIAGTADWEIEKTPNAQAIHFDTRYLTIKRVTDQAGDDLDHTLAEDQGYMGSDLKISLKENTTRVIIEYATQAVAPALQWLNPTQTLGKNAPFLFTQSQAILARSWIPCQDSPGIRFTYNAQVKVPDGLMAVMSAENPREKMAGGKYVFNMPQPIPSYLMALAVGDFEFGEVGPRTAIYAEKGMLEKALWEFTDMENMLIAAEELYGPYAWDRYDLIVLPPSFPFGGMENPRITFATPTVVAGDRSLTSLVAHELAHSWSGNVVTNSNWNDFWLNEGFTVYFERRIMEALYGADYAEMLAALGFNDLKNQVDELGAESPDTHLQLNLKDRDPDEGMTDIAYEKGYFFLREIEGRVGREKFDQFLRNYFELYAFKPMDTEMFLEYLNKELGIPSTISAPSPNDWVFGPGIPMMEFKPSSERFARVRTQAEQFSLNGEVDETQAENWTTVEWLEFLHLIPDSLNADQINILDSKFELSQSGNSEIFFAWMKKLIRSEHDQCLDRLGKFLTSVGRRKFILPLFEELVAKEKYSEWALETYKIARSNYHSVTYNSVDALFEEKGLAIS